MLVLRRCRSGGAEQSPAPPAKEEGDSGREDEVVFFQAGGMILALWGRDQLAADSRVEDLGGFGGVTLAHDVRSPAEVDRVMEEGREAGAIISREAGDTFWGG